MKELSKKKLKEKLHEWLCGYESHAEEYGPIDGINYEEDNQALKQIRKIIEEKK